jgi:hypothetical protein
MGRTTPQMLPTTWDPPFFQPPNVLALHRDPLLPALGMQQWPGPTVDAPPKTNCVSRIGLHRLQLRRSELFIDSTPKWHPAPAERHKPLSSLRLRFGSARDAVNRYHHNVRPYSTFNTPLVLKSKLLGLPRRPPVPDSSRATETRYRDQPGFQSDGSIWNSHPSPSAP